MTLLWSAQARADREQIFEYIEADSPDSAVRIDDRIEEAIDRLIDFPLIGRPGRVATTRELVIPRTPYLATLHPDRRIDNDPSHSSRRTALATQALGRLAQIRKQPHHHDQSVTADPERVTKYGTPIC